MRNTLYLVLIYLSLISFLSCEEETGDIPTVSTKEITEIMKNSAISGSIVDNNGGKDIIGIGICWSTESSPTLEDNYTSDDGFDSCNSNLTGLEANTRYYVRAYATNDLGTGFGEEIEFITLPENGEVITDVDGNSYLTVTIGTQVWMGENLKTTKYQNGDDIGTTTPVTLDISSEDNPKYQWSYEGNEDNVNEFGRLYTWHATTDERNVCPDGWHIPTEEEWKTLFEFIGGEGYGGGKLKSLLVWEYPNTAATNEYEFSALPGGMRYANGSFDHMYSLGCWWTSTRSSYGTNAPISIYIYSTESSMDYITFREKEGRSVRCVRD